MKLLEITEPFWKEVLKEVIKRSSVAFAEGLAQSFGSGVGTWLADKVKGKDAQEKDDGRDEAQSVASECSACSSTVCHCPARH